MASQQDGQALLGRTLVGSCSSTAHRGEGCVDLVVVITNLSDPLRALA
jgi:hypothetical protein